jgi:hypothetical protein
MRASIGASRAGVDSDVASGNGWVWASRASARVIGGPRETLAAAEGCSNPITPPNRRRATPVAALTVSRERESGVTGAGDWRWSTTYGPPSQRGDDLAT